MNKLNKISVRAFRAPDDPESSRGFVEGHRNVLSNVGVKEVTSSSDDWINDPNVIVVLIESEDKNKIYGGSRIHIATSDADIPLIGATESIDPNVRGVVESQKEAGTGEICGLWNSLEVAGYGVGSIYAIRAAISLLPGLNLKTCFALCSPYTAKLVNKNYGTKIETSLGNNGTFYYPKIDLLATIVRLSDSELLEGANEKEKSIIRDLRTNPIQTKEEIGPKGEVIVEYNLSI